MEVCGGRTVYIVFSGPILCLLGMRILGEFSSKQSGNFRNAVHTPAMRKYTARPPQPGKAGTYGVRVFSCALIFPLLAFTIYRLLKTFMV